MVPNFFVGDLKLSHYHEDFQCEKFLRTETTGGGGIVHGINCEDVKVTTSSLTCLEC